MEFSLRGYLSAGVTLARDAFLRFGGIQSPLATLARFQFVNREPFVIPARPMDELPIGTITESHRESLRTALMARRVNVKYVPVVSLATDQIIRFEAVPSDRLIALAERVGLGAELDEQVLNQACQDACKWPEEITVAVRVSAVQSQASTLDTLTFAALANSGLSPERLNLELAEAALVEPTDAVKRFVDHLRRGAVKVALDDFGTGYASLNQLLHLQFDRLKIDRRFVDRLDTDVDSAIIVRAIIRLASDFGIGVTAKGIETAEQVSKLVASGCEEGQGPYIGNSISLTEIHTLLGQVDAPRSIWGQNRIH
jgi:EAL domain-containing protein (putative c-di-GMP-specific phosphodiesterase class I)